MPTQPTGVNPRRYLDGFSWDEFKWRRGELRAQFAGLKVLVGVDDMDVFKGIELKLQAFERLLDHNPDLRGKIVLVQVWQAASGLHGSWPPGCCITFTQRLA